MLEPNKPDDRDLKEHLESHSKRSIENGYSFMGEQIRAWDDNFGNFKQEKDSLLDHIDGLVEEKRKVGSVLTFLDIGAGDGELSRQMKQRYGNSIRAVSVSLEDMRDLDQIKKDNDLGVIYVKGPIEQIGKMLEHNKIDLVYSSNTLVHLADPLSTIEEVYQKSSPNAELYLKWDYIQGNWSEDSFERNKGIENFMNYVSKLKEKGIDIAVDEYAMGGRVPFKIKVPESNRGTLVLPNLKSHRVTQPVKYPDGTLKNEIVTKYDLEG